jgi:predicted nucleic acid-binding protein
MEKTIVADSSSIISLAVNCMSSVLGELGVHIAVTEEIYDEIISRPMNSKRYSLESLRIRKLFTEGVISIEEPEPSLVRDVLETGNSIYRIDKHDLRLIHGGEAAALALMREKSSDVLLIDERTTRMMVEDPAVLCEVLSSQMSRRVFMDAGRLAHFRTLVPDVKIIRSCEVAAIAYEKGILSRNLGSSGREVFAAVLYALKFSGCAVSWQEIEDYLRAIG